MRADISIFFGGGGGDNSYSNIIQQFQLFKAHEHIYV